MTYPGGSAPKAGPTGWLAVVAGVCGLLGLFLPWFTPAVVTAGVTHKADASFHAWNGFFFLIIAPVLLILGAVLWLQAMRGNHNSRFAGSSDPVRALSRQSILFGAVSIVIMLLSFPILTSTYKFKTGTSTLSWSSASKLVKSGGGKLERGTQFGVYLVLLGGVLLIVAGVLGLVMKSTAAATESSSGALVSYDGQPAAQFGGFPLPLSQQTQSQTQQGFDQPSFDQPSFDQPSYDQPSYDYPSYDQPGHGQPGTPPQN